MQGANCERRIAAMGMPSHCVFSCHVVFRKDYCAPKVNYAEVRDRVSVAYAEKANEIADATSLVQGLSREVSTLLQHIKEQCA